MYLEKFFHPENEDGGGAAADEDNQIQEGNENSSSTVIESTSDAASIPLSQLKAWGFDSVEQMNEHFEKAKAGEPTEEDKKKQQEIENADFRAYAIKSGHLKEDDFKLYDKLTTTSDRDLVFEDFLTSFKEDNPEIDAEDMEEAAKEAFDGEYRTASEKRFKREASLIRQDTLKAYNEAREDFKDNVAWEGGKNKWTQFVAKTIEAALPGEDLKFFTGKDGDDDINVSVKLTKEEKAEIAKQVLTPRRYAQFLEGKVDEVEKIIKERVVSAAMLKNLPKAIELGIQEGIRIGKNRGSYVGSVNPFPIAARAAESQQVDASVGDALKQVRESYKNLKSARGG